MSDSTPPSSDAATLHLVQLWLDPRRLVQIGAMNKLTRAKNLTDAQIDTNYLVHCALGELFGDAAPQPFCVEDDPRDVAGDGAPTGRHVRVLGYASMDADALEDEAALCSNPTVHATCDWDRFDAKPMPDPASGALREGRRLGFEVRACPVVRRASSGSATLPDGETRSWHEGQELDAFLAASWDDPGADLRREDVYVDWLRRQWGHRGGAEVERVALERFSLARMTRRTHGDDRSVKQIKRPDVTLRGTLRVTDPDAFHAVLARGLGRHKSFGYGMLKIRRA